MKRLIALLLVLVLLAGCAVQAPEPTTVPTTEATEPTTETTQPPGAGLYIPDSTLEQQTGGAVKAYDVHDTCEAVYPMGENLLLFLPQSSAHQIQVYAGEELYLQYAVETDAAFIPGDSGVQITDSGISYYHQSDRQIVLLDASLNETGRVELPWGAQGTPVVDSQQKKAYFCTENEIRVLDLETGIASLLRQEAVTWQSVYDVCFDGAVLLCDVIDEDQSGYLAYISTENGKLLGKDTAGWDFDNFGDAYLLTNASEPAWGALYGTWDSEVLSLTPAGEDAKVWSALALGGAVGVHTGDAGTVLDFYALESGLRTASVTLPEDTDVNSVVADAANRCIWFLLTEDSGGQVLCRWDYGQSVVEDETVYLLPRYTEQAPDVEGLDQCQAQADLLAAANGMDIRIWKDAVHAPWEDLQSDYRVSSFRETLDMMEQVLSQFPEGMVVKLAPLSDTGVVTVSLVAGDGETVQSRFRWVDGSIYIALETGADGAGAFCNALYRAMDTYIMNSTPMLDEWDSGEPVNDRATIFQNAMTAGMEDYFEERAAQDKLEQLCEAIREAFGLEDYEGTLLWEQYLSE